MIGSVRASQFSLIKSASLKLTPSSGSYATSSTLTVTIYVNSGGNAINGVESDLTYNASLLQYVSTDFSTGAFAEVASNSGGSGSVLFTALSTGPMTGNQIVAVITFTVLGSSGTTPITFASTCHVVRSADDRDLWNGRKAGASFTLT